MKLNKHPSSTRKLNNYLKAGIEGAHWYDETRQQVQAKLGNQWADTFIDILAATSPNTSIKANVTIAYKALDQLKYAKAFKGYMPVVRNMLDTIRVNRMTGHRAKFGGSKVQNFADALNGDGDAVVVDRWMLRAFGYPGITAKRYRDIEQWITTRAQQLDMSPAQVQAAIWCGIKEKEDNSGMTAEPFDSFL